MKKPLLYVVVVFITQITYGQIETKTFPQKNAFEKVGFLKKNSKAEKIKKMPSFNIQSMLEEDKMSEGKDVPFRFGKGFDVNISLSDGAWLEIDGGRLWSLELESTGAYSINFIFDNFYLPEGATLYISNNEGSMLYGPVTSKENTKDGRFMTDLIAGDKVTIYLFEPNDKFGSSKLTIKRIIHGYKNLFSPDSYGNFGGSWACNNDVVCFPDWDKESDAVALVLLSSGTEWCSGSLLMTANSSFSPYFLSAFHCIDDPEYPDGNLSATEISNAENWMFKFQYKKSACNGSTATTGITFNGARFRSGWSVSDFVLMEMNNSPIGNSEFTALGWDRSGSNPMSGTGIHHPAGDVMKISFDNDNITPNGQTINWSNNNVSPINSHWTVGYDNGTTQGGSSGSPLFNENRRVVGQLHGGASGCAPVIKSYGRFNISWTGGGTDATRLSNWLDPNNTGVITTNTSRYPSISGPSQICSQQATYTIANLPAGATVAWSSNGLSPSSGTDSSFTASPVNYAGAGYVRATITKGSSVFAITKNLELNGYTFIDGPDEVYLSDVKAYFTMDEGITVSQWTVNGVAVQPAMPNTLILSPISRYYPGGVLITCTGSANCGTFTAMKEVQIIDDVNMDSYYQVYPNPTSTSFSITQKASPKLTATTLTTDNTKNTDLSVAIYNSQSLLVRKQTVGINESIDVHDLRDGTYIVHITKDSKTYRTKLSIRKK